VAAVAEHTAIREQLERRLAQLEERTGRIQAELRRPGDRDWPESATQRENDEVLERLDEAEVAEMALLRAALTRLESGSYGRCRRCEGPIQEGRLRALPYADTCIDCAEAGGAG
jgi:RNA polymerase-binding transcription factor DksA